MTLRVNQKSTIFAIIVLGLFIPGYFGFYEPMLGTDFWEVPVWINWLVLLLVILTIGICIRSLAYQIKITEEGITQKTLGSWSVKWGDIEYWGCEEDTDYNSIYLNLYGANSKKEFVAALLHKKNYLALKSALEEKVGNPLNKY